MTKDEATILDVVQEGGEAMTYETNGGSMMVSTFSVGASAHDEAATSQETAEAMRVADSCRQGDVIARRVGASAVRGAPTPRAGVCAAAGAHGEHRLIAKALAPMRANKRGWIAVDLAEGGLLVHTDSPSGRHAPMQLDPGCWEFARQRALDLDGRVVVVKD